MVCEDKVFKTVQPLTYYVCSEFKDAIAKAFPLLTDVAVKISPATPSFGLYQCNNAMAFIKKYGSGSDILNGAKNPGEVGRMISDNLTNSDVFDKITVAPAGFVTITLNTSFLIEKAGELLTNNFAMDLEKKESIIIDFSSPNTAKEMHIGHLRSTIIGDVISRILEECGQDVSRVNHIGDWGTQFGMLIEQLNDHTNNTTDISELQEFYRSAKKRFDEDEEFKQRAQDAVVRLQAGEKKELDAWTRICDASGIAFKKIYDQLKVKLTTKGESFYNSRIPDVLKELEEKKLVEESNGALCYFEFPKGYPLMVKKSNGGYGYASTDAACIRYRTVELKADWLIYVVDIGQALHLKSLFALAKAANWAENTTLSHVAFGLVMGADNKKMKTRSGDTVKLQDVIDQAIVHSHKALYSSIELPEDTCEALSSMEPEKEKNARILAIGSIKYFDLSHSRESSYAFSFERMLDSKGNTALSVLYAQCRMISIFKEKNWGLEGILASEGTDGVAFSELVPESASEIDLLYKCLKILDAVLDVTVDLNPKLLTEYMWGTVQAFNKFYTSHRILGTPEEKSRLVLCIFTFRCLKKSLDLLGIDMLESI